MITGKNSKQKWHEEIMKIHYNIRTSAGFTLLEILIAMTISFTLLAGMIQVVVSSNQGYKEVQSFNVQSDFGRIALEILSDATLHAGHWAGLRSGNITNSSALSLTASGNCDSAWITDTGRPIQGFDGASAIAGTSLPSGCIGETDYVPNSDILVVRYADPASIVKTADLSSGDNANTIFVRTVIANENIGSQGEIFKGADGISTELNTGDNMGSYNFAYRSDIYFLRPCSVTVPSCDNVPTLVRMRYGESGYVEEPFVENVEQMQLVFGSDTDGDLSIDRYDSPDNVPNWDEVVNVRFDLVLRNNERGGSYTDGNTYDLAGSYSYTPISADRVYRRRVYSKSIQIRNLNRI